MIVNENNLIYNINSLVCVPKECKEKVKMYEYNFKYIYLFETTNKAALDFIDFVNKNNIREVVFIDYRLEYELIIDKLENKINISFIMTTDLASLTAEYNILVHNNIINLCNKGKINKIGVLDESLYLLLKRNYENVYLLFLDEEIVECEKTIKNGIGLINESDDPKHSYYNELSAISLVDEKANIMKISPDVRRFLKQFNIEFNEYKNIEELIDSSKICLDINFCNSNNSMFLKSMDKQVPCIIGNSTLLKEYENLDKYLRVKSDDNIDEISEKILNIEKNKDEIFNEYKKFREEYSKKSKKRYR